MSGRVAPASKSRIPPLASEPLGFRQNYDATIDSPSDPVTVNLKMDMDSLRQPTIPEWNYYAMKIIENGGYDLVPMPGLTSCGFIVPVGECWFERVGLDRMCVAALLKYNKKLRFVRIDKCLRNGRTFYITFTAEDQEKDCHTFQAKAITGTALDGNFHILEVRPKPETRKLDAPPQPPSETKLKMDMDSLRHPTFSERSYYGAKIAENGGYDLVPMPGLISTGFITPVEECRFERLGLDEVCVAALNMYNKQLRFVKVDKCLKTGWTFYITFTAEDQEKQCRTFQAKAMVLGRASGGKFDIFEVRPKPEPSESESHKDIDTGKDSQQPIHSVFKEAEREQEQEDSADGRKRKRKNPVDNKMARMDILQEHLLLLNGALTTLEGITAEEKRKAHRLFAANVHLVLVFFGCKVEERLEWLRGMLD